MGRSEVAVASAVDGAFAGHLRIADQEFESRLFVGTGKYPDNETMVEAIRASGTAMVTVAVRRVDLDRTQSEGILFHLDPEEFFLLPNTAGCYTAEDAIRYARLARAAGFNEWLKLEVIGDETTLVPDTQATLEAAKTLVAEGFNVMAYTNDDLVTALRLEDAGCVAVMPLASPIGSGARYREPVLHPGDQASVRRSDHRGRRRRNRFRCVCRHGTGGGRSAHEHGYRDPPLIRWRWRTRCGLLHNPDGSRIWLAVWRPGRSGFLRRRREGCWTEHCARHKGPTRRFGYSGGGGPWAEARSGLCGRYSFTRRP